MFNGTLLKLGVDKKDFLVIAVFTIVMFVIGILKEKGINIREKLANTNIIIRWIIYFALILSVIIFGAYGVGYVPVDPMYANY